MIGLLCFVLAVLASPFKSKLRLQAENAVLRHQLIVVRRRLHGRVRLTNHDRWFFIQLYRWFPSILQVLTIIRPETLVRWHRAGFLSRDIQLRSPGTPPPAHLAGWKDVVLVEDKAELLVAFNHPATREHPFMYHCHILEHEDAGMMGQYVCA